MDSGVILLVWWQYPVCQLKQVIMGSYWSDLFNYNMAANL